MDQIYEIDKLKFLYNSTSIPKIRQNIVKEFKNYPSLETEQFLISVFQTDRSNKVRSIAALVLADLDVQDSTSILFDALNTDLDDLVKSAILLSLVKMKYQNIIPILFETLELDSVNLKALATVALCSYNDEEINKKLTDRLQIEKHPFVRKWIILSLCENIEHDVELKNFIKTSINNEQDLFVKKEIASHFKWFQEKKYLSKQSITLLKTLDFFNPKYKLNNEYNQLIQELSETEFNSFFIKLYKTTRSKRLQSKLILFLLKFYSTRSLNLLLTLLSYEKNPQNFFLILRVLIQLDGLDKKAIEVIIERLSKTKSKQIKKLSIWALSFNKTDKEFIEDQLISILKYNNKVITSSIILSLGRIQSKKSIPLILNAYLKNEIKSNIAISALQSQPISQIAENIRGILSERKVEEVINKIITLLIKLKLRDFDSFLMEIIRSRQYSNRLIRKSVFALGILRIKESISLLSEILESDMPDSIRFNAAYALGQINDKSSIPLLEKVLKSDRSSKVRSSVALAISKIGKTNLSLKEIFLKEPSSSVRESIAIAIGKIQLKESLDFLIESYYLERSSKVRKQLYWILKLQTPSSNLPIPFKSNKRGEAIRKSIKTLLKSNNTTFKFFALNRLAKNKAFEIESILLNLLEKECKLTTKLKIIKTLGKIGTTKAIHILFENLKTNNIRIRHSTVNSLKKLGEDVIPYVFQELKESASWSKQSSLCDILIHFGEKSLQSFIELLNTSENISLRIELIRSIGLIKSEESIEPLINLLIKSDSYEMQEVIIWAISNIVDSKEKISLFLEHLEKNKLDVNKKNALIYELFNNLRKPPLIRYFKAKHKMDLMENQSSKIRYCPFPWKRRRIIKSLKDMNTNAAIKALQHTFENDSNKNNRITALYTMSNYIQNTEIKDYIANIANSDCDDEIRNLSSLILGNTKDKKSLDTLLTILKSSKSSQWRRRAASVVSLNFYDCIEVQSMIEKKVKEDKDDYVRANLLIGFGIKEMKSDRLVQYANEILDAEKEKEIVKIASLFYLGRIFKKNFVSSLLEKLSNELNRNIRKLITILLLEYGDENIINDIFKSIHKESDKEISSLQLTFLRKFRTKSVINNLLLSLTLEENCFMYGSIINIILEILNEDETTIDYLLSIIIDKHNLELLNWIADILSYLPEDKIIPKIYALYKKYDYYSEELNTIYLILERLRKNKLYNSLDCMLVKYFDNKDYIAKEEKNLSTKFKSKELKVALMKASISSEVIDLKKLSIIFNYSDPYKLRNLLLYVYPKNYIHFFSENLVVIDKLLL